MDSNKLLNLRNKYKNHPVIKPIINYCDNHDISFEFVKEKRLICESLKSFRYVNYYYMKIGEKFIESSYRGGIFGLIVEAYKYLGMDYHANIIKTANLLHKKI